MTGRARIRTIQLAINRPRRAPRTATWEVRFVGPVGIGRQHRGGGTKRVTENERRADDSLRASDLVLRGVGVVGLIAVALVLLLMLYPA